MLALAVARQLEGFLEERQAGAEDHRRGQHELQQAQAVAVRHGHAQDHQRRAQRGGGEKALACLFAQDLLALDEEAALGERIHRARCIAEALDQRENRVAVELAVDGAGAGGEIDGGVPDARIALQRQLDQRRAGGAGHSLDRYRTALQRAFGNGLRFRLERPRAARQHGGDLRHGGKQIGTRYGRRVEMDGQRADPALGTDFPNGRPLAQQDFEQVEALPVALRVPG